MGQGSRLIISNYSSYTLKLESIHSYQMNSWDGNFPSEIKPGEHQGVYVEFNEHVGVTSSDDAGDAIYLIDGTDNQFQIRARFNDNRNLSVDWKNTINDTRFFPQKLSTSLIDLGWEHDGVVTLKFPPGIL